MVLIKAGVYLDNEPSKSTSIHINLKYLNWIKLRVSNGGLENVPTDIETNDGKAYQGSFTEGIFNHSCNLPRNCFGYLNIDQGYMHQEACNEKTNSQ